MSTATYQPLRVSSIDPDDFDQAEVDAGQSLSTGTVGYTSELFDDLPDDHPGVIAWEGGVVDEAIAEVMPEIRRLIYEAVTRRLPWTWEPER